MGGEPGHRERPGGGQAARQDRSVGQPICCGPMRKARAGFPGGIRREREGEQLQDAAGGAGGGRIELA